MVGILTSVMLMFLNKLYEEENELSRQQKKEIEELNKAENQPRRRRAYWEWKNPHEAEIPVPSPWP